MVKRLEDLEVLRLLPNKCCVIAFTITLLPFIFSALSVLAGFQCSFVCCVMFNIISIILAMELMFGVLASKFTAKPQLRLRLVMLGRFVNTWHHQMGQSIWDVFCSILVRVSRENSHQRKVRFYSCNGTMRVASLLLNNINSYYVGSLRKKRNERAKNRKVFENQQSTLK